MQGGIPTKLLRLARDLARTPRRIPLYLQYAGAEPLHLRLPWFSWAAIDFLKARDFSNCNVFEFGSGGSTLFFSDRALSVTSVEDNRVWHEVVSTAISDEGLSNARVVFADASRDRHVDYGSTPYVNALDKPYDVIVVDGTEDWPDEIVRPVCFERAESFVSKGSIIIVDDAWRYDGKIASTHAVEHRKFESIGPGRPGVTRTDVYFY